MGGRGITCVSCQCPTGIKLFKIPKLRLARLKSDKSIRAYLKLYGVRVGQGMIIQNSPTQFATSEGIGFSGIVCTSSNAKDIQTAFWDIYMGRKLYHEKSNGVMAWKVDLNGNKLGLDSASDGDQDWILALILAYEKIERGEWTLPPSKTGLKTKDDIKKEITRLLTSFYNAHIRYKHKKYVFLSSDGSWAQRGDKRDIYYSSYPDPYALCLFSKFDSTHDWSKISSDIMELNEKILLEWRDLGAKGQNPMPAKVFVTVLKGGTYKVENYYKISQQEGTTGEALKDNEEDSIRFFLRMARAAILSGNTKAKAILEKILTITKVTGVADPHIHAGDPNATHKYGFNNNLAKAGYAIAAFGAGKRELAKKLLGSVQKTFNGTCYSDWADAKKYYYPQSIILQSILLGSCRQIVSASISICPAFIGKVPIPMQALPKPIKKPKVLRPKYLIIRTYGGARNLGIYVDEDKVYVSTKSHPRPVLLIAYGNKPGANKRAEETAEAIKYIVENNRYSFLRVFLAGETSTKRVGITSDKFTLEDVKDGRIIAYQTLDEYSVNKTTLGSIIHKLYILKAFAPYSWKWRITKLHQKLSGPSFLPDWVGADAEANVRLLMKLAKYYCYDENYDKAIETYRKITSRFPAWKKNPYLYFEALEELALAHLYKSFFHLKTGTVSNIKIAGSQINKSISTYQRIINKSKNKKRLASVYYNLSHVYYTKAVTIAGDLEYEQLLNSALKALESAETNNNISGVTGIKRFRDKYLALKIQLVIGDIYLAKFDAHDPTKFESDIAYRKRQIGYLKKAEEHYKKAERREKQLIKYISAKESDYYRRKQAIKKFLPYSALIKTKLGYVNMHMWRFTEKSPITFPPAQYEPNYHLALKYLKVAVAKAEELKENVYFFSGSWDSRKIYFDVKIQEALFYMEKYYKRARTMLKQTHLKHDVKARRDARRKIEDVLLYIKYIPLASQKARAFLAKIEILIAEDYEANNMANKDENLKLIVLARKQFGPVNVPTHFKRLFSRLLTRMLKRYGSGILKGDVMKIYQETK